MHGFLSGIRVIEGSAFVASPLCGLSLLQMGADVIRFDTIGGGPDFRRWPQAPGNGGSLYWEGLNKGKKSIAIDLKSPEGRELAMALVTAPDRAGGPVGGLFVTNYPVKGFLAHGPLAERRPDLVSVRVMGWPDGTNAVDYTINSALGYPLMTGPALLGDEPVNHVMPSWDVATGLYAALALIGAERARSRTGKGAELRVPLGDVARATLGNLGHLAEVTASGADRPRIGNDIFGAFGGSYATSDDKRVMIVALTARQWRDLVAKLKIGPAVAALEAELGEDLTPDEGRRYIHRERLRPLVAAAIARLTLADFSILVEGTAVCWAPYNSVREALADGWLFPTVDPLFDTVEHPSGVRYPTPKSPIAQVGHSQGKAQRAPLLGQHTDEVLADVLGLGAAEIGRLHDRGIVASAAEETRARA